jgi:hypothetical protein
MSNFLAIAAVTETFRQMLGGVIGVDVNGAVATAVRPNGSTTGSSGLPNVGVNVYLYHVSPNPFWRNEDHPTRREEGSAIQRPRAAFDLHYLLSFHGNDLQMEPQRVLGSVVRTIHTEPLLSRERIQQVKNNAVITDPAHYLTDSDLADEIELVKFSFIPLTLEELSKLWSVFFQVPYILSVAYEASVVFIESTVSPKSSLPVRDRNLLVIPFQRPAIKEVLPQIVLPDGTLTIKGENLKGEITKLRYGETVVDPDTVNNEQIAVDVPGGLFAGVRTVQVIHQVDFGTASEPHLGFESNVAAFILAPLITTPHPISAAAGATLSLSFNPPIGQAQKVTLLIGDQAITIPPRDIAGPPSSTTLDFPIPSDFSTGTFLLRVQVDGAESPLEVDTDSMSPTFNQYIAPTIIIT